MRMIVDNRGAKSIDSRVKRVFITMPSRVFEEMREVGLLNNIDFWMTNLIMEEIERRRGNEKQD